MAGILKKVIKWWRGIELSDTLWGAFGPDGWARALISFISGVWNGSWIGSKLANTSGWEDLAISVGIVIALFTWGGVLWCFNQYYLRRQIAWTKNGAIIQSTNVPVVGGVANITDHSIEAKSYFKGQDISIRDLIVDDMRIIGKTFEDCIIRGPAILWSLRTTMSGSTIEAYGAPASLYSASTTAFAPTGAILLKDCHFIRCKFRLIGFAVPPDLLDDSIRGLPKA